MNSLFRQLVNAVSRKTSAARLPSDGLRLNASKSESMLIVNGSKAIISSYIDLKLDL